MEPVHLDVGGTSFVTSRSTLERYTKSFFGGLLRNFSEHAPTPVFIDRDGTHFRYILNWLRGCQSLPGDTRVLRELREEADFYCLQELVHAIDRAHAQPPVEATLCQIKSALTRGA